MTHAQRFRKLLVKHPDATVNGYYWCSGKRWSERRYCVVLTAKHGTLCEGIELRADTSQALHQLMAAEGFPVHPAAIGRLCHSAPRSPRRPVQRAYAQQRIA